MVAGIAIGATAIQALHAQGKPKAYSVTEIEVLDQAALAVIARELGPHLHRERVLALGPVQRDRRDAAVTRHEDLSHRPVP